MRSSSQAVSREPCSSGRVSVAIASAKRPCSWTVRITAKAVPRSTAARPPVLQMVSAVTASASNTSSSTSSAPRRPMAPDAVTSSSRTAKASSSRASGPSAARAATRSTIRARFTAVGRALRMDSTAAANCSGPDPVLLSGEHDPVAARHTDRRRAPHREASDRIHEVGDVVDLQNLVSVGQAGLIDDPQPTGGPIESPLTQIRHAHLTGSLCIAPAPTVDSHRD